MKIKFRKTIHDDDVDVIRDICNSTGFFREEETEVAVELIQESLLKGQEASGYHFIMIEQDGATCGFTCYGPAPCTEGTFDLYWIVVDNNYRGKGLGLLLLKQAEQELMQIRARKLYIETSSTDKYLPTRKFYIKAGYTEVARLKDYYLKGDDKIIFAKKMRGI